MQTYILGKELALETSIENFQAKLKKFGFEIEETSWLNPVPNVWSVHIKERNCPQCFANGKGACQKSALASALGEFFERLTTNYFFNDFYLGKSIANADFVHFPQEKWFPINNNNFPPQNLLTPELWQHFDPQGSLTPDLLVDLQSGNEERGIVALPFRRELDDEIVYFPVSILSNLYVSNGMASGNTITEAKVQALSEIFERLVKHRILQEAISLPEIPSEFLENFPKVTKALASLRQAGFPVIAYDASLGGQYPVVCLVLLNPQNGTCFASFGAHPNFAVALERTLTELLQGRSLKDLESFSAPSFDNDLVSDFANLESHFIDSNGVLSWDLFRQSADFEFIPWNFSPLPAITEKNLENLIQNSEGITAKEYANLCQILHSQGKEIYVMEYDHLEVHACRIVVPSVSEIYPVDDLIYANNNSGLLWREILLDLPNFQQDSATYMELLQEIDEQSIDDQTLVREFLGILCEPNSHWYYLRIGELKALLLIALNNLDNAKEWVEWTIAMNAGNFPLATLNYYRALQQALELFTDKQREKNEYQEIFANLYGENIANQVWHVLKGGNPFFMLKADDENLINFPAHQRLLKIYHKSQLAKQ